MAKKAKKGAEVELDEDLDEGSESEDEGDEDEAPAKKAKGKKAAKSAKSNGNGKKAAKSDDSDEDDGYISIGDLAAEAEINAQSARVKLREAELDKPEGGRWRWKDGSKALKAARKALGL
jgi:hypothetical protein